MERQLTTAAHGHVLTNCNVWSRDSRRIVYDVRSDPAGEVFDGARIETVDVETGEVRVLFESTNGANCGVATNDPTADRVAFIVGPERPTADFTYGAARRRGAIVDEARPGIATSLDARDLVEPYTPGALRGGSHVHVFSPDGRRVSFTYEDHVLATAGPGAEPNQRNVGVCVLGRPVRVSGSHPRNHDGEAFSVLVTRTTANPPPGSDQISKAFEDAWIGPDGRTIVFQGHVVTERLETISELFVVELPEDLTVPGDGPLEGTATTMPRPPQGFFQRRLTFTADRPYPGLQGPRHWPRSSPDGTRIACLMRDDSGIVQLWTISPTGRELRQLTRNQHDVASAFTWSPDGQSIGHVMDRSVCLTKALTGATIRLTEPSEPAPRPEACVFSPDGRHVAFVRTVAGWNQIFVAGSDHFGTGR